LLSNAIKFSLVTTAELGTRVSSRDKGQWEDPLPYAYSLHPTPLKVPGQGSRGIPADKIETIFERFQQVDASDSRKRRHRTRLICRSIVQHHGGQIWVESTLGSTFFFTCRCFRKSSPTANPSAPWVLVCDDDSIRAVVHHVRTAGLPGNDGGFRPAAVEQALQERPDVILLNPVMPGMHGWETLAALKEQTNTKDIP